MLIPHLHFLTILHYLFSASPFNFNNDKFAANEEFGHYLLRLLRCCLIMSFEKRGNRRGRAVGAQDLSKVLEDASKGWRNAFSLDFGPLRSRIARNISAILTGCEKELMTDR